MSKEKFNFENFEVWQKAIDYSVEVITVAEGKGRYSKKEFIQFLYVSKGSLFEVVTILTVFHKKGWRSDLQLEELKEHGAEIGRMLSALISTIRRSLS